MREMTTVKTVYSFDELSDRAKEKARDWYREVSAQDFADFSAECVLEDASRLALLFGLNIKTRPVKLMGGGTRQEPNVYWAVESCDAGASYAGWYAYAKGSVAKVAAEAPAEYDGKVQKQNAELNRIVQALADVQRRNFYRVQASVDHARNVYNGVTVEVERSDDVQISDTDRETVTEALQDFASWIHRQLEAEWEYRQSDECVDEDIRANEYEFDEDGTRA
jgi:hypothetical protein